MNYNCHNPTSEFLGFLASNCFLNYILQPTRITSPSKTLIDSIFTNVILPDSISGNLTGTISDHLPQFLIVPNISLTLLSTSKIFMREIGLTLIKKILFLIIFPWIGMKLTTEEQNIDYSTEIVLNEVNKLLDNFAPCEKPTKFNSKPRITPGLQKSISLKNKSLSDFLEKKGSYY